MMMMVMVNSPVYVRTHSHADGACLLSGIAAKLQPVCQPARGADKGALILVSRDQTEGDKRIVLRKCMKL